MRPTQREVPSAPVQVRPARVARAAAALAAALAVAATLAGCVPLKQYRTVTVQGGVDQVCEAQAPNESSDLCALEHRTYTYDGVEHDYYFATVEFDDQGWFWDRRQLEVLLRFLYESRDEAGGERQFLIFAHAHGWQHNADACDNNVVCFQRFLERMDVSERGFFDVVHQLDPAAAPAPRKVVGLYLGWRGRSGAIPTVRATTFYTRKDAGSRVGIGGVTELLTRLNDFRRYKNRERLSTATQLIVSGHSFGGQVIYKALAQLLIERSTEMWEHEKPGGGEGEYRYGVASSFGDLVVLVNPAFEGSAYESLQFAATNRCYPPEQRPVMLVVTSRADSATGTAFPLGRRFGTLFGKTPCREERRAVLRTVGHNDRYRTHELLLKPGPGREAAAVHRAPKKRKEGKCGCPYLGPTSEFSMAAEDAAFADSLIAVFQARRQGDARVYEPGLPAGVASVEEYRETSYGVDADGDEMVLDRSPEYAANYPYLVISTGAEFIPDHSSIYGERFTDFLRRFYFRHLAAKLNFPVQCFDEPIPDCRPTPIAPCDRSWSGRAEYGCAGAPTGGSSGGR